MVRNDDYFTESIPKGTQYTKIALEVLEFLSQRKITAREAVNILEQAIWFVCETSFTFENIAERYKNYI